MLKFGILGLGLEGSRVYCAASVCCACELLTRSASGLCVWFCLSSRKLRTDKLIYLAEAFAGSNAGS